MGQFGCKKQPFLRVFCIIGILFNQYNKVGGAQASVISNQVLAGRISKGKSCILNGRLSDPGFRHLDPPTINSWLFDQLGMESKLGENFLSLHCKHSHSTSL